MIKINEIEKHRNMQIMGGYLKRFYKIYVVLLMIISAFELSMIVRGIFVFNFNKWAHIIYFISYFVLLIPSFSLGLILVIRRNVESNLFKLGILLHVYSAVIIIWSVMISFLDMLGGETPIVYLTMLIVIGGVFVIDPLFYLGETVLSIIALALLSLVEPHYKIFLDSTSGGYYINCLVFVIMALVVCSRNYRVNLDDTKVNERLKLLAITDQLTGLKNESYYMEKSIELENKIKNKEFDFGIIVMDVNNVKNTNDTFGHHFGCHLIVTAGKTLPTIFKTSTLFHLGGDEFVVIVEGEDFNKVDKLLEKLSSKLTYKEIEYKEHKLILSVAYGYARCEKGMSYTQLFQAADELMYKNKIEVKEKYNIKGR